MDISILLSVASALGLGTIIASIITTYGNRRFRQEKIVLKRFEILSDLYFSLYKTPNQDYADNKTKMDVIKKYIEELNSSNGRKTAQLLGNKITYLMSVIPNAKHLKFKLFYLQLEVCAEYNTVATELGYASDSWVFNLQKLFTLIILVLSATLTIISVVFAFIYITDSQVQYIYILSAMLFFTISISSFFRFKRWGGLNQLL